MSNTAHPLYRTAHGEFRPGDVVWHVGPSGDRTRPGTIRDTGPAFSVVFHDAPGVHLVPAGEVRHPGSVLRRKPATPTLGDILRAARGRVRQDHIVVLIHPGAGPLPAPYPKVHRNRERAESEASRLAAEHPGSVFRVFAAVSEARAVATVTRLAD